MKEPEVGVQPPNFSMTPTFDTLPQSYRIHTSQFAQATIVNSIAYNFVIPAKAGIQSDYRLDNT